MTTHTQWIEVHGDGAVRVIGWRCDGCGQVKWQDEQPDEACDLCAEQAPAPATSAPPASALAQPLKDARVDEVDEGITAAESARRAARRSRGAGPSNPERTQ